MSKLLRPSDGKMCCLGSYLLACGVTKEQIEGRESPDDIDSLPETAGWTVEPAPVIRKLFSDDCERLMRVNDVRNVDEKYREERVIELFAKQGITVEFIN